MIRAAKLAKLYKSTGGGLAPLDLEVGRGQWLTLLGPSGCGKSTLLKLVAGLEESGAGQVEVTVPRSRISFVFQEPALLPWSTVEENVILPLRLRGMNRVSAIAKAIPWMQKLGILPFRTSYPSQLSGGLKMRVSLARALITDPELLLLDEPFAALDEPIRIELGLELRELFLTMKPTILMVTHSITEGLWLGDRVLVFQGRPGQVVLDENLGLGESRPLSLRGDPRFMARVEQCFGLLKEGRA
jgi:NitT/TauT family transport system ATP-binding protein